MEILCKNFFYFHIISFYVAFIHDFIIYTDFTRIAASNTATDDIMHNLGTHNI